MNFKIGIQYILIYLLFNALGVYLAFTLWWTDSLTLSSLNKYSIGLLFSVMLCAFGASFISVLICRSLFLKPDSYKFITPLGLVNNEYFKSEIGVDKAKKFKQAINLISFGIIIFTILAFRFSINAYENHQLKNFGKIETVRVTDIHYDIKKLPYAFVAYANKSHNVNLRHDKLTDKDFATIIYSTKNPEIVKFYDEFQQEKN
jgi:hypothetical protein